MVEYSELRRELERAVKSAPVLTCDGPWRQSGWTLSLDGNLQETIAPLVSVRLFEVWTKVVQTHNNGWDGESFHVSALFDETKTVIDVVAFLDKQFRGLVERERAQRSPSDPRLRGGGLTS